MTKTTYLCAPYDGLWADLNTIESEKTNGSFRRDSKHKKLVISGNFNFADRRTLVYRAFFPEINVTSFIFIVYVDEDLINSWSHQVGISVIYI